MTEPWVEKKGASYAYAYDKGGKLARHFGVKGIPDAVLIDPTGKVAWRGHPGALDDETIQAHLAGSLSKPLYDWPSAGKPAAQALVKRQYAAALEKAAKAPAEGGLDVAAEIKALIGSRLKLAEASREAGDFLGALEAAEELAKGLKGLPEESRAAQIVTDIGADAKAKPVLEAQREIRKLREKDPRKRKEVEKTIESLREIIQRLPGTQASKEAEAFISDLQRSE